MIDRLAETLQSVRFRGLTPEAQEKMLLCLLANLCVAVPGVAVTRLPEPAAAASGHWLFSGRRTASAREAAFWNAAAMHARTQDDFHPLGNLHVGTVVIPVSMALAERFGSSGEAFLDAVTAGYAGAIAMSRNLSSHTTPRGLRSTCLYTPFGAATAAARLNGFDATQLANALAITASAAGGFTQCWVDGSDEWQYHVARAADCAIQIAELTRAGVRGGAHQLDGNAGFFRGLVGFQPDPAMILADAEPNRGIMENVIKIYPVSGICQPVTLLAERMAARAGDVDSIERVRVYMTPFEMNYPGTLNKGPFRSFSDVLMSAAFCTASVLTCGRLDFADLLRLDHPRRDRLIGVTEILPDEKLGTLSCRTEILRKDGSKVVDEVIDGGKQVVLDWKSMDPWGEDLFAQGGRKAAYARVRDAVRGLVDRPAATLLRALAES